MAENNQELDRTEPATPYKLEEARKKGQVAKSLDFNSFITLAVALAAMMMFSSWGIEYFLDTSRAIFSSAGRISFDPYKLGQWFEIIARSMVYLLSPLIVLIIIGGVLGNILQTGPVFSTHPLKPDPKKLNPVAGFKRVFSLRMLVEGVKSILKLTLFSAVAYWFIAGSFGELMGLQQRLPESYPAFWSKIGTGLFFALVLAVFAVALIDLIWSRYEFAKKMRMSKRELKEEHKRREGDPHIRAKQREAQRELRKRASSVNNVPNADVLITNPTHLAIALEYRMGEMVAPKVIGKGAGLVAAKMREAANKHGVPIVEQKALARELFRSVKMDSVIQEGQYHAVAAIFKQLMDTRQRRTGSLAPRRA